MRYPRIVYGPGSTVVEPSGPLGIWTPGFQIHGGARRATSGVGAGYVKRTDYLCEVLIRCWESEQAAVSGWLEWALLLGTFTFRFDKDVPASQYTCRLVEPVIGQPVMFQRSTEFPRMMETRALLASTTRFTYLWAA